MDYYINIYFLLFKVKNYPHFWIIKISDDLYYFKNIIKNIDKKDNEIGNYYIIKRRDKENILDENFKQFQLYLRRKDDDLIAET